MLKRERRRDMADVNVYTAGRISDMARSLESLARSCRDGMDGTRGISREDGQAALEMAAAMVCGSCGRCSMGGGEARENYYLYYLLRVFEQNGSIVQEDMPSLFLETCRQQQEYLEQLNRNLGRALMNLEWKNRFLESRDTVMVQFRELAMMLEEFAHQLEQATDITKQKEGIVIRAFRLHHMEIENMLILEYENRQREAYLTVRAAGGRCVLAKDAAQLLGRAVGGRWYVPPDTRALITRQAAALHFLEEGEYRVVCGVARRPRDGECVSGDNYTCTTAIPGQVVLSLSDGMGSGERACRESQRVVELTQQLMETGFSARASLKMVNTILLLGGSQQHPATLDLCCVDLHTGVLETMKMGASATFIWSRGQVELLEAEELPVGVLNEAEPMLISRKLWDGDRIIMVSDGVLDACPGEQKEACMKSYLEGISAKNPQQLAEMILDFACQGECARDDMTVLTAGVWKMR